MYDGTRPYTWYDVVYYTPDVLTIYLHNNTCTCA